MDQITEFFIIAVGLNILLFLPAYFFQSDKLTDFSYSLTFIILGAIGYGHSRHSVIDKLSLILVVIWAIRLGAFLFIRILKQGKDNRFDAMRKRLFSFLRFWLFQGVTAFVVMLPALLIWQNHGSTNYLIIIGCTTWAIGLATEAIADYQKFSFKLKGVNSWIDEGLWRVSRHPNYLGEITVWIGFYLVTASALLGIDKWIALASPVYIFLILMKFSGVPLLENSADKKWGKDKDYLQYKKDVPVLLPSLTSLHRLLK